jgi:hypothetical protein
MEKFCAPYISYWKRALLYCIAIAILVATPPQVWAVTVSVDTTISADTTNQQDIDTANVDLINNATIDFSTASNAILLNSTTSGNTITNNAGGTISAGRQAIGLATNSGGTINNSGTITLTGTTTAAVIQINNSTGVTINNNAGGVISGPTSTVVIRLDSGDTLVNSGSIINTDTGQSFRFAGNNSTVTLKEGSIVVGTIQVNGGTTGSTLKIEQGFGQAYFYDITTLGTLTLEDLSGNTVVQGSAGSVGLGAQESVDELLGLRAFNLRSALKRYSAAPAIFKEDKLWAEPFSYYSKRGTNSSVLGYENYGYGINFIYPLKQHKLDLIFTIEKSELEIDRNHDVSRTHLLAGVNATDFADLGDWKASGFFVAGTSWHNGTRDIFTNTTSSGKDNITANCNSKEIITGAHISKTFHPDSNQRNTWKTELGFTFGYSFIED